MRAAAVARSTSSGEMNGSCRLQAIRAPDAIDPTSATATSVASQTRRSSQSQTATTPTPASAGIENPNVINRSAGNQPVSNPTGAPDDHERGPRREHPPGEPARPHQPERRQRDREPLHVSRPAVQGAFEVGVPDGVGHARATEERRPSTCPPRGERARSSSRAARPHDRAAATSRRHPPGIALPAALVSRERPRSHRREDERADQEELRMREAAASQTRSRPPRRLVACRRPGTPPPR